MIATDTDGGFQRTFWAVGLVGAALSMGAAGVFGLHLARSVAIGAAIAVANLWSIVMIVRGLLGRSRWRAPWGLIAALKLGVLFGGLYVLLKSGWAELMPLLAGYGALPVGIVTGQLGVRRPLEEEG
jgi:hypothetical protein